MLNRFPSVIPQSLTCHTLRVAVTTHMWWNCTCPIYLPGDQISGLLDTVPGNGRKLTLRWRSVWRGNCHFVNLNTLMYFFFHIGGYCCMYYIKFFPLKIYYIKKKVRSILSLSISSLVYIYKIITTFSQIRL